MSLEGLGVRVPLCSLSPYLFFSLNIQVTYFISDSEAWSWMDSTYHGWTVHLMDGQSISWLDSASHGWTAHLTDGQSVSWMDRASHRWTEHLTDG